MAQPHEYICYSLPRLVSMGIQCTFCAYFWELYTGEFGWTKSEYGTVSALYSLIQIGSFAVLGLIFKFAGTIQGSGVKWILIAGTIAHWFTYFLLIILPIKWHGVKTPYVDSVLGKQSQFFRAMFGGPVPLSSMATSRGWYRFFCIPWAFVKFFWVILYPFMKVCFFCGGCCMGFIRIMPLHRNENIPVLETLRDPACSACCNTTCCNNFAMRMRHFGRWMGTRTFLLYMITIVHGIGVSAHELSNKALESYAFPGDGTAVNVNLSFFFISNLLVYILFSLLKFYMRARAFFAETFFILSILFFVLQIPILPAFFIWTPEGTAPTAGKDDDMVRQWFVAIGLTTFHATIVFLIFSGGPLIFYVSMVILNGDTMLMSFGILVLFGSL